MAFLRHASRHVHYTVANHVEAQLNALGWMAAGGLWGGGSITVIRSPAFVGSKLDNSIEAGIVSITLGDEQMPSEEELGGAMSSQLYPFFIDVFMDTDAEALALATDIKDILLGRTAGGVRFLPLVNQIDATVVEGWSLELEDIERIRPEHAFPLQWHTVHATACAYFLETVT